MFTDLTGKTRLKIGLHTHTTLSDGHKTPEEVAEIVEIFAEAAGKKMPKSVKINEEASVIPADPEDIQKAFVKLFASGTNDECKIVIEHKD